jgi:hypothetical protein
MFRIVIRDGHVLTTCRKPAAAERLLAAHVDGKRANLFERLPYGSRVVSGPVPLIGNEIAAQAVVLIEPTGHTSTTTFAIEPA